MRIRGVPRVQDPSSIEVAKLSAGQRERAGHAVMHCYTHRVFFVCFLCFCFRIPGDRRRPGASIGHRQERQHRIFRADPALEL